MRYSKLVIWVSIALLLLALLVIVYFVIYSGGSYLPAWISTVVVVVGLLLMLSIPKFVILSPTSVEIHSVMELTVIKLEDIKEVRLLSARDMRGVIPCCGVSCFFGYYGYYLDLKRFRICSIYSRNWANFVEITCKNNQRVVIGVIEAKELFEELNKSIGGGEVQDLP